MGQRKAQAMWARPLTLLLQLRAPIDRPEDGWHRAMRSMRYSLDGPPALYAAGPNQAELWRKMFGGVEIHVTKQIGVT